MIVDALQLLARANLAAGLAIAIVALVRWPVRSVFGAAAAYRLWAIPPVMALASLLPAPESGPVAAIVLEARGGLPSFAPGVNGWAWPAAVAGVWALGALLLATTFWARQSRFARALREGIPMSVAGTFAVRAARPDLGPAVIGRAIIVPSDFQTRFTPAEQAAVIAHEAQHLARGDVAANVLVALVQCVCWFNPLVHLAARWIRFDQELACDAAVVAQRPGLRRPYAEALLKTQVAIAIPPAGCAWRARGFPALKERIRLLKQGSIGGRRRTGGAVLLAVLTLGGGYAAWATQPSPALVTEPDWSSRPTGADVARFYPPDALAAGLGGMSVMECRVEKTGALSACVILREGPSGAGFGAATLRMAPLFQMRPMSRNGRPVAGGVVRIPVRFLVPAPEAR